MNANDRARREYLARLEAEAANAADRDGDDPSDERQRARRRQHQSRWVEIQIQQGMRAGEFDNLPGAGRPLRGLDGPHDPDWWVKQLLEREDLSAALPPALALRTENARLEADLDRLPTPQAVRQEVVSFNARIIDARRQLQGGPPVITPLRDVEAEIAAWQTRRDERRARNREQAAQWQRDREATAAPSRWRRLAARFRQPR